MKRKKKKIKFDPVQALRPKMLRSELEPLARELYDLACCGSSSVWTDIKHPEDMSSNPELKKRFLTCAHNGMVAAQKKILDHVLSSDVLTDSHKVLYQGIADSIAWQLIGQQLCYARRLYRGHRQPSLDNCNLESTIAAADHHVAQYPGSVALISDLTSFVQIGDLLTLSSQGKLGIIEVKEGEKNRKIANFIDFYSKSRCDRAFYHFAQEGRNWGQVLKYNFLLV